MVDDLRGEAPRFVKLPHRDQRVDGMQVVCLLVSLHAKRTANLLKLIPLHVPAMRLAGVADEDGRLVCKFSQSGKLGRSPTTGFRSGHHHGTEHFVCSAQRGDHRGAPVRPHDVGQAPRQCVAGLPGCDYLPAGGQYRHGRYRTSRNGSVHAAFSRAWVPRIAFRLGYVGVRCAGDDL